VIIAALPRVSLSKRHRRKDFLRIRIIHSGGCEVFLVYELLDGGIKICGKEKDFKFIDAAHSFVIAMRDEQRAAALN
jgi:hypothetical protein